MTRGGVVAAEPGPDQLDGVDGEGLGVGGESWGGVGDTCRGREATHTTWLDLALMRRHKKWWGAGRGELLVDQTSGEAGV